MKKIRIGIIGTGGIANSHINVYKNFEDVEIVAGADIIPGKAAEFFKNHDLPNALTFERHEELLELDLDGVSICTYNSTHSVCTIDALNSDKHVLLEKPMSVTLEEAVEMVKTEKKTGKILTIGFQPRYDPNMQMIKEIVKSGSLGKIYYVQTGGGRRRGIPGGTFIQSELAGVGALADIGCYSLDMALNTLGYPKPLTVSAYSSSYFGTNPKYCNESEKFNVDDFSSAFIRLEGGIVLDFKVSWAMHMDTMGDTLFLGTDAGLKVKSPGLGSPWGGAWDGGVGPISIFQDVVGQQSETTIPLKENGGPSLFEQKVRAFVDSIKDNKTAPIPTSQILYNQAILDGIIRSSKCGHEVEIVIPEI